MSKKSQILEIIKKNELAKSSEAKNRVDTIVADLKDPNHNAQVPESSVPSASKSSVLYKAGPKMPSSPAKPLKPEGFVPPGTQAAMTAGKQNQPKIQTPTSVSTSMKPPMKKSKILEKLKLKKAANPDAKADEELAENVESLVENHEKFHEKEEKQEMEKSESDIFMEKAKELKESGHDLAAFKLAEVVLKKSVEGSEAHKAALEFTTSIPKKDEYNPQEVAVAALAKTECMGKAELVKSKYSDLKRDLEYKDKDRAYHYHAEKRSEPQVGVHKDKKNTFNASKGRSEAGHLLDEAKRTTDPVKADVNKYHAKKLHEQNLKDLKAMPKPNLTKADHQPHPGPSKSEHQKAYDAKQQAESEAKLKSPEGEKARKLRNSKVLEMMRKKKNG